MSHYNSRKLESKEVLTRWMEMREVEFHKDHVRPFEIRGHEEKVVK